METKVSETRELSDTLDRRFVNPESTDVAARNKLVIINLWRIIMKLKNYLINYQYDKIKLYICFDDLLLQKLKYIINCYMTNVFKIIVYE